MNALIKEVRDTAGSYALAEAAAVSDSVPVGYQRTEVGVIPDEWKVLSLGEFARLQRGFDLPHGARREGTIPIVSSAGITGTHDRAMVSAPGVVTGRYGTIGQVFFIMEDFWPLNTTLFVRDFKGNDAHYVALLLGTIDFQTHSGKSGVPGVNRNDLHEERVICPTVREQSAIAAALSDVDALLLGLDQLIAKKRDLKQAAMQQLLTGQIRLPGFGGKWEETCLGALADFYKGRGLPKSAIAPGGRQKCIHYGELFTKYRETIHEVLSYTNEVDSWAYSQVNDVLMPTSDVTPRGLATASCLREEGVILGGDMLIIRAKNQCFDGIFLSYCIAREKDQILQLVTGSTVYHLYASDMARFSIEFPSLEEQTAIATILSDMDAELATLETRRAKTRELKQGMMQALLTGRIRLT